MTTPHWMKPCVTMPLPSPMQRAPRGVSAPEFLESFSPARLSARPVLQIPPAPPKPDMVAPAMTPYGHTRRVDFLSPVVSPPPPNFAYQYPVALPQNPYTTAPMIPGFGVGAP